MNYKLHKESDGLICSQLYLWHLPECLAFSKTSVCNTAFNTMDENCCLYHALTPQTLSHVIEYPFVLAQTNFLDFGTYLHSI
jgi:hypothetical protein